MEVHHIPSQRQRCSRSNDSAKALNSWDLVTTVLSTLVGSYSLINPKSFFATGFVLRLAEEIHPNFKP